MQEWALNVFCAASPISLCVSLCWIWLSRLPFNIILCYASLSRCAYIQISRIENMSHLSELRVLNLAGNNISRVENLQGLDCLTELNLRHNCISVVVRGLFPNERQVKAFYSLRAILLLHIKEKVPTVHSDHNLIFNQERSFCPSHLWAFYFKLEILNNC